MCPDEQARFHARSGLWTATFPGDGIELNVPVAPVTPLEAPADLARASGVCPLAVYLSHPVSGDRFHPLVEVVSEQCEVGRWRADDVTR